MAKKSNLLIPSPNSSRFSTANHESSWGLRDRACLWHPFTQAQTAPLPITITRGSGSYLYSECGRAFIDATSSWWVNLHGHAHPYMAAAIAKQALELEHVIFAGYTHPQAITFAERLLTLFPKELSRVFYSDNGSTSVEVALKMAFQASHKKKKLLSFHLAYHGDTFGAMSAAGKTHFNRPFWPYLFSVESITPPLRGKESQSWNEFMQAIESHEIGAFIFEPHIQGVGGMLVHSKELLGDMIQKCQERSIITIADEVMTGFGRTGPLFVSNELKALPDLICLSKGITGGFLPLGATIAKEKIFDAFLSDDPAKAFLHGHSYTANPLSCAAANASLDLLLSEKTEDARKQIESSHKKFKNKWESHPKLCRCEVVGTILILEYRVKTEGYHNPIKHHLTELFMGKGAFVRPFGNVLHIVPPYCITPEQLEQLYQIIEISLEIV